jgi:hypothetical protein
MISRSKDVPSLLAFAPASEQDSDQDSDQEKRDGVLVGELWRRRVHSNALHIAARLRTSP